MLTVSQTAWGGDWRGCTGRLKHSWSQTWTRRKASALPPCGNLGMFAVKSWNICQRAPWVAIDWLWGLIKKRSPLSGLQSSSGTQHIKGTAFLSHVVHHLGQDNAEWGPKRSSDKARVL